MNETPKRDVPSRTAEVVHEYAFDGVDQICGVTTDATGVWFVDGTRSRLVKIDPETGRELAHVEGVPMDAGTAFDGRLLYQAGGDKIYKIDPETRAVVGSIQMPDDGTTGLAFAEGALYAGRFEGKKILKIDPQTGAILKTLTSDRYVTGVSFRDGELWHGTMDGKGVPEPRAELRRIDPATGEVLARLALPPEMAATGLEADGEGRLWVGDCKRGKLLAVKKPVKAESSAKAGKAGSSTTPRR